jgi:hypothetical protein
MKRKAQVLFFFIAILIPLFAFTAEKYTEPLSVYLTWQNDPTTTMTVQWITETNKESDKVFYRKIGEKKWKSAVGNHTPMPKKLPYLIHRVELTNLQPNTSYYLQTGENGGTAYKFRTMPSNLERSIRFVVGGDMYHDSIEYLIETNRQAAKMDPMFALVGGDIAYGGAKTPTENYKDEEKRWMKWIMAWKEQMVTPEGYLIPFLPCIGNHDVNGRFDQPKENAPFFYALFAFPGPNGYNVMDFGNYMTIIILDSGHTNPVTGEQTEWLQHTLGARQQIPNKFALYHVPAYPSVRKPKAPTSKLERENWSPIFESNSLSAAFENHDHAYKRTNPILKDEVDPTGVVYIGDGAWGVKSPRKPKKPDESWYIAQSKKERHFILVTVDGNERRYQAIKHDGEVFDTYTQLQNPIQPPKKEEIESLQTAGR